MIDRLGAVADGDRRVRQAADRHGLADELGDEQVLEVQADRPGVEAGDLQQVLDQRLEAGDVADQQVERRLRPARACRRGGPASPRRCAASVISGERSSWLTSLAKRASRSTRCCSASAMSLNAVGSTLQVVVVGGLEAGVEPPAGDRLGGLGGVAQRADGAAWRRTSRRARRRAS